jgi:serine-type D-Ala-D-Ala carboxypeptidase/endopeptidase
MRRLIVPFLPFLIAGPLSSQGSGAPALPSPDSVRAIVAARIADRRIPGLAVGRLAARDALRVIQGRANAERPEPVTASTVFEIGSITKAFTGVLLADMVLRGEVSLDDPVAKHLPAGTRVPEKDGVAITLRHLATHTSGLPRLPANLRPKDSSDPYADYDAARLTAFLSGHQLVRAPGASYEYSNLGAGLLGYALATRAGMSYGELLLQRILRPLGMDETGVTETETMRRNLSSAHDMMGVPSAAWHFDVLAGAGAIRSTLDDMLRFGAAARDTLRGPLARAMALSQRELFRVDSITSIGLGWHRRTRGGHTVAWHNGGTGGFRSMMVVDAGSGRTGVLLSNSAQASDALGLYLIDASVRVPPLPPARPTVPVDGATLARYPGVYRLGPTFAIEISRRGDTGIDLQATGQQKFRLYASSPVDFFVLEVEASITFESDASGKIVALVLHQNGAHQRAVRDP